MWEHWVLKELWSTVGKRNEENLWIMVKIWTNWNLIREPLGMIWPYGGSGGSAWRINTAEKKTTGRKVKCHKQKPQKEGMVIHC
jgi:hypothetical protein